MRRTAAVALLALGVLAGCGGLVGDPADQSDERTATDVAPESPTETVTPPAPGIDESRVVDYGDLNDGQRAAVREAVTGSARFVPDTEYVNDSEGYPDSLVDPFHEHDYVRYDGRYYEIRLSSGRLYASYGIEATPGVPGENDTAVAVEDLPDSVREEVREAVETGDYHAPMGKWDSLPEPLAETDYVSYENETYRLGYAVGDYWAPVVELEPVDG